jgi:hypothetical protein
MTRKLYRCKKCEYATTVRSNYKRHKQSKTHNDEKRETKTYRCKNCDYETRDSSNWRKHCKSKRHLNGGNEPITKHCELCAANFATREICRVHMYRHYDTSQLLSDIARMKGRIGRVAHNKRPRWLTKEERSDDALEREQTYVKERQGKLTRLEQRLEKMKQLYTELTSKHNKKKVPKRFTDTEVDIMAEERDAAQDRLAQIEDDTTEWKALFDNAEYTRLEEREQWLTHIIIRHRYGKSTK